MRLITGFTTLPSVANCQHNLPSNNLWTKDVCTSGIFRTKTVQSLPEQQVGGFNPLKNISQWEGLSHVLWKKKNVPNHQPQSIWVCFELHTPIFLRGPPKHPRAGTMRGVLLFAPVFFGLIRRRQRMPIRNGLATSCSKWKRQRA